MHTYSYCKNVHCKLLNDDNDDKIFCVFYALDLP